jgi:hypothetical protein
MEKINEAEAAEELIAEHTRLIADNARLRAFVGTCRAEVKKLNALLAAAEERAAEVVKVYEAIDKLTAAKLYAARLEKQLSGEGA